MQKYISSQLYKSIQASHFTAIKFIWSHKSTKMDTRVHLVKMWLGSHRGDTQIALNGPVIKSIAEQYNQKHQVTHNAYLKDFFIKYSSSKHYNSFGIDDGVGASEQLLGGLLFTVQNEGDGLLVHTDGHSMPPGRGRAVLIHTLTGLHAAYMQTAKRLRAPFVFGLSFKFKYIPFSFLEWNRISFQSFFKIPLYWWHCNLCEM